jgi:hypothetical protein
MAGMKVPAIFFAPRGLAESLCPTSGVAWTNGEREYDRVMRVAASRVFEPHGEERYEVARLEP